MTLLKTAQKPVSIAGGGVQNSGAVAELTGFAETYSIPVTETLAGRANLLNDHPLNIGPVVVTGSDSANTVAERADVLRPAGATSNVIVGNDEEFGFMAGDMAKGLEKAQSLSEAGVAIVIYKIGEHGAVTFAGGEEIRAGNYAVTAVKPNGAGDSFMAGLLAALAEGRPLREAVLRGSACASIVVSQPGCAPAMPTPDQLDLLRRGSLAYLWPSGTRLGCRAAKRGQAF